jgi:hypothetical protein
VQLRRERIDQDQTSSGKEPRQQLALALLVEHLRDNERAIYLSESFMRKVVANFDNDWRLTGAEIDTAISQIEGR